MDTIEELKQRVLSLDEECRRAKQGWSDALARIGVCPECGKEFEHDAEEPFAYCDCGTTEWAFTDLEKQPLAIQVSYLKARVACLESAGKWQPFDTAPEQGAFLVWLPVQELNDGGHVWPMRRHPVVGTIGHHWADDARSQPTHWMPAPEGPQPDKQ
jgi:hypothetical protein